MVIHYSLNVETCKCFLNKYSTLSPKRWTKELCILIVVHWLTMKKKKEKKLNGNDQGDCEYSRVIVNVLFTQLNQIFSFLFFCSTCLIHLLMLIFLDQHIVTIVKVYYGVLLSKAVVVQVRNIHRHIKVKQLTKRKRLWSSLSSKLSKGYTQLYI